MQRATVHFTYQSFLGSLQTQSDIPLDVFRSSEYNEIVIVSFRCTETEKIYREQSSRKFGNIQRVAFRRLLALNAAETLADLTGNGMALEALRDDRKGQYSIRINGQYRVCFVWSAGNAAEVEIVDYH